MQLKSNLREQNNSPHLLVRCTSWIPLKKSSLVPQGSAYLCRSIWDLLCWVLESFFNGQSDSDEVLWAEGHARGWCNRAQSAVGKLEHSDKYLELAREESLHSKHNSNCRLTGRPWCCSQPQAPALFCSASKQASKHFCYWYANMHTRHLLYFSLPRHDTAITNGLYWDAESSAMWIARVLLLLHTNTLHSPTAAGSSFIHFHWWLSSGAKQNWHINLLRDFPFLGPQGLCRVSWSSGWCWPNTATIPEPWREEMKGAARQEHWEEAKPRVGWSDKQVALQRSPMTTELIATQTGREERREGEQKEI